MRLLLVEDDCALRSALADLLRSAGFAVDESDNGERGVWQARTTAYDLLILDYYLPDLDGRGIIEAVRADGLNIPIIIITGQNTVSHKTACLDSGGDDYLTKPFDPKELLARIRALLRRPAILAPEQIQIEDLRLDLSLRRVWRHSRELRLTCKEFSLLEYLVRQRERVVTRAELLEHVWDMNTDTFSNTVDSHILNLRKKMDRGFRLKLIETIPGIGYRIRPEK